MPLRAVCRFARPLAGTRLPARQLSDLLDDRHGSRVREVAKPELDWVGVSRGRQFVHERLDGEHVGRRAQAAHRRRPQDTRREPPNRDAVVGDPIQVPSVAIAAPGPEYEVRPQELAGDQLPRVATRSGGMCRRRDRVVPNDDVPTRVHGARTFHEHGGAFGIPPQLVFTRPLDPDWRAHCLRQQRSVSRCVVRAVVAIATRCFGPHDVYARRVEFQQRC